LTKGILDGAPLVHRLQTASRWLGVKRRTQADVFGTKTKFWEFIMTTGKSGSKGGNTGAGKPSTTGKPSGGGRDNAPPKGKK
jgi:hypothetical protein